MRTFNGKHLAMAIAIAMSALAVGCVATAPKAQGQRPQVAAAPAAVAGVQPPAAALFSSALTEEQKYDMFLAQWVAGAQNDNELFERGALAYGDVRTEYRLRTASNHSTAEARAIVLPMIRAWIAKAPRLSGPVSFRTPPMELGQAGFSQMQLGLELSAGWAGTSASLNRPEKHGDPKPPAARSQGERLGQILWANKFEGKDVITKITYIALSTKDVVLPLTPQQIYDLRRGSRDGKIRASMAGGYLVAEKFYCGIDREYSYELKCRFKVVDQALAPIVLR